MRSCDPRRSATKLRAALCASLLTCLAIPARPAEAKPGTGGRSILVVDGQKVAEGRIPKTQPFLFSADEGADVGMDGETNVSPDYAQGENAFTGEIVKVTVEQK